MLRFFVNIFYFYITTKVIDSLSNGFDIISNNGGLGDIRHSGEVIPFTLEETFDGSFLAKDFNGTWISPTIILYKDFEARRLRTFDVRTLESSLFPNVPELEKNPTVELSADGSRLLFGQLVAQAYLPLLFIVLAVEKNAWLHGGNRVHELLAGNRMSNIRKYRVYDYRNKIWSDIQEGGNISLAIWSTVGNDLFYVYQNDIYQRIDHPDNSKVLTNRLTFDGVPGLIYNGVPDWVYEEEVLKSDGALRVNLDGKFLIYATFNDTKVNSVYYPIYGKPGDLNGQYTVLQRLKYPKAGSIMPDVSLSLMNLTDSHLEPTLLNAPVDVVGREHILFTFSWLTNETIVATWTNRVQNVSQIVTYDLNGKMSYVLTVNESEGWVSPSEIISFESSLIFLLNQDSGTPAGRFMHVTRFDLVNNVGENLVDLTPGPVEVLSIIGIDENRAKIYYFATPPREPSQSQLYSVPIFDKKKPTCHSCNYKTPEGKLCKYADAKFSPDKSLCALTCLGPDPAITEIFGSNGGKIFTWQSNEILRRKLSHRLQPVIKDIYVTVNGYRSQVKLFLPPEFDGNKEYPLLVKVYGGPNAVEVIDSFNHGLESYMTTNRSTICAFIEGRGSGNKGSKMLFEIYRALGTVEIEDIIAITKHLQNKFSWIDAKRTAIWGWSYGGYASAMTLATDRNSVFKCGISVAPVTTWIYYDSIYTERYMGLPTLEDNLNAYNRSDLTRLVEGIRGKEFLLIHGTGDDNVHYQNSMALSRALSIEDISFEEMSYPDERHSLSRVFPHLYHTIDRFLEKCLKLVHSF